MPSLRLATPTYLCQRWYLCGTEPILAYAILNKSYEHMTAQSERPRQTDSEHYISFPRVTMLNYQTADYSPATTYRQNLNKRPAKVESRRPTNMQMASFTTTPNMPELAHTRVSLLTQTWTIAGTVEYLAHTHCLLILPVTVS